MANWSDSCGRLWTGQAALGRHSAEGGVSEWAEERSGWRWTLKFVVRRGGWQEPEAANGLHPVWAPGAAPWGVARASSSHVCAADVSMSGPTD